MCRRELRSSAGIRRLAASRRGRSPPAPGGLTVGAALLAVAALAGGWTGCEARESGRSASPGPPPGPVRPATAHPARVVLDGRFDDWQGIAPLYADSAGDAPAGALDLGRLWAAHDRRFLFLRVELGREIHLHEENDLTLYLDTDGDPGTGEPVHGIGAEVEWRFGERTGRGPGGSSPAGLSHHEIGLVAAPTVRSRSFEIALRRAARPGGEPLFRGDTVRLALVGGRPGGDRLPGGEGGLAYRFAGADELPPPSSPALDRPPAADLRVLTYNVQMDGLFDAARQGAFSRLLKTIRPDLVGLQEIEEHGASETEDVVASMVRPPGGGEWHAAKAGQDLVAVSRYPIRETHVIPGWEEHASAGFLVDARPALGSELLFVVAHPPCCNGGSPSRDVQRQEIVDGIVAFLRDAKTPGGRIDLPAGTPVVIAGDMNFVGDPRQPRTLRTGQILDRERFGEPIDPDWDGTGLEDVSPRVTGWPMTFTWYDEGDPYPPGRLDYVYLTDSVLEAVHGYVLFTPALPEPALEASGLERSDSPDASDHLPVVVDLRSRP